MKIKSILKGFTLIELLVVITIIAILATGWVAIFTKQLQWARDSTRINDIKLLESSAQLYFSDNDVYPAKSTFTSDISAYTTKTLSDPKKGIAVCWQITGWANTHNLACNWYYAVWADKFGLANSSMKLSVSFEKEENMNNLAKDTWVKWDGWNNDFYYEAFAWAWAWTWTNARQAGTGTNTVIVY